MNELIFAISLLLSPEMVSENNINKSEILVTREAGKKRGVRISEENSEKRVFGTKRGIRI